MNETHGEEVFLVPVGDETVLALPIKHDGDTPGGVDLPTLIGAVGPLLAAVVKRAGGDGARLYELSPESQRKLGIGRPDQVGNYFRGVVRNGEGRFSHQIQLREVQPSPPPSGFDALAAVQMAAVQAQLSRIEDTLSSMAASLTSVVDFLETQQRARVEAALRILREVHDRARQSGTVTQTDWGRLTGVELELETQLGAITNELANLLGRREFGKGPKNDAAQMDKIRPERVDALMQAHRMLVGGLRGWYELLMLRKYGAGELVESEVAAARQRLAALEEKHQALLQLIDAVVEASKDTAGRPWIQRLLTDGLVFGSQNDDRDIRTVRTGRKKLAELAEGARAALPSAPHRPELTVGQAG